jgi:hypothetical protein
MGSDMTSPDKGNKESGHSSSGGAGTSGGQSSSTSKQGRDEKNKKNAANLQASQNMLSNALPFLFPNPSLMYNPLGLGSFPLGGGISSPFAGMGQGSSLMNGLGANAGGKKGSAATVTSKGGGATNPMGVAGLNIPSFLKKDGVVGGNQRGKNRSTPPAPQIPANLQHPANPDDSDDESMKSLMGNHADDLPDDDSPNEHAERIVLKESKELEKEMAQQKMDNRREKKERLKESRGGGGGSLMDSHRGGLTAEERQLLMIKKKERLAKEDLLPLREFGRTTRRSAAATRSRLEEAVSKMRGSSSDLPGSSKDKQ